MAQVEIWAQPGQPLKEQDWLDHSYKSLADYITKQKEGHSGHTSPVCKICDDHKYKPLVSFGMIDLRTGEKEVKMICPTLEELPTENIEGILEFNPKE